MIYAGSESPTSELNGLPGDYSGLSELGGFSMGQPDSEELSELGQRDCHSPVSSIDEIERAVAGNRTASITLSVIVTDHFRPSVCPLLQFLNYTLLLSSALFSCILIFPFLMHSQPLEVPFHSSSLSS